MSAISNLRGADVDARSDAAALEIRGASKQFGSTQALDSVDLHVAAGTVVALVGANGSGKSTLIKALAGYHILDDGRVSVHGHELSRATLGEQASLAGLRFLHQDLALVATMSIADNLAIARGYARTFGGTINWRAEHRRARAELTNVGASADPNTLIRDLGPVDRTLVAVARALDHVDPSRNVLLLDEPTARLPKEEASRLIAQLGSLRDRGLPIVYVTHRLEEIYGLADAITVLRDGRVVFAGPLRSLPIEALRDLITGLSTARSEAPAERKVGPVPQDVRPVLELRGVSSRQLRDVSLTLRRGEILGVTGLIGSGRSELGRIVFGLQRYTSGSILIDGQPELSPLSAARTSGRVGYTPQDRKAGLLTRLPVEQNATIASFEGLSGRFGLSRGRIRLAALDVIRALHVQPPDPTKLIDLLSGGNQQKVALGRWIRLPLKLIILDEPTQSIDIGAKAELMGVMREKARADGLGVLWLESDVEELVKYADRIFVMKAGQLVQEFAQRPFVIAEVLAACYGATFPGVQ